MQNFSDRVYKNLNKFSESQIETVVNELRLQNELQSALLQSISSGLIVVDTDWKILELNKAAERLFPFTVFSKEAKGEVLFEITDDDDISLFFRDCFEKNKTNVLEEYTVKTSSGAVHFLEISVTPLVKENKISGSIIKIEDVTTKRNQEVLLHRMETMAGLTNLAASVAHEIKNPLGAISIHIQLIQKALKKKRDGDGLLPDPKFAEGYLDVVNQEIERLNKIVVDFLLAVRPISAELMLVRPVEILKQFVDFIIPEAEEKNVKIKADFCKDSPRVLLDEKLFREVIVNLAQNAMDAIQSRFENLEESKISQEKKGRLEINAFVKNDSFIIEFADNGCGMNSETKKHIFEPYFTTKAKGTGLGLAMSYKIVKEFGGEINVESEEGSGTCFTISIPLPQENKALLTHSKGN